MPLGMMYLIQSLLEMACLDRTKQSRQSGSNRYRRVEYVLAMGLQDLCWGVMGLSFHQEDVGGLESCGSAILDGV